MKSFRTRLANERGFSFLEVMIALVLTGIVTAAVFQTYVVQHENYMAQDDVVNVQQNTRAAIAEMTRHLRMAGYDLPAGVDGLEPHNGNPDSVTITYRTDDCQVSLRANMASASADIVGDSTDEIGCFQEGEWAYIYHPDSGGGEWFQVLSLDTVNNEITPVDDLSRAYWDGSIVVTMNQITFYVDNTTDADNPSLMMQLRGGQPQIYAENISDLQLRYRLGTGVTLDEPVLVDQVTEVLISVTGQSSEMVEDVFGHRRERTFETSVYLRNNTN